MKKVILLLCSILLTPFAYADENDVFPISTEMQIGKIRNLIEKAPENGIYLSVGGERAFRGASMYKTIEHLVIFDISPVIIKFNIINALLLKAKDKELYKHLRWNSEFSEWQKIDSSLTEEDFKWWTDNIRSMKGYDVPERLNKNGTWNGYIKIREKLMNIYPKVAMNYNNRIRTFLTHITWEDVEKNQRGFADKLSKQDWDSFEQERKLPNSCVQKFIDNPETAVDWADVIDYKSGNYLFDDKSYSILHKLAINNKITILQLNLGDTEELKLLANKIEKTKNKIAILDLDNLYLYEYMGEIKFKKAVDYLTKYGVNDSVLILMNNYKDFPCTQFSIYVGFTFENIKSWPNQPFFDNFINSLPADIQPLIDGRLYEGRDKVPLYLIKSWK